MSQQTYETMLKEYTEIKEDLKEIEQFTDGIDFSIAEKYENLGKEQAKQQDYANAANSVFIARSELIKIRDSFGEAIEEIIEKRRPRDTRTKEERQMDIRAKDKEMIGGGNTDQE